MGTRWKGSARTARALDGVSDVDRADESLELRKVVQALRAENQRLNELYERAPVGFVTLDPGGRVMEVNDTAARMFGTTRRDLMHSSLVQRALPEDMGTLVRHIHEVLGSFEAKSCQITFSLRPPLPSFVGHLDSVAVRGPEGMWWCRTTISDATALWREHTERAARLQREQLRREEAEAAQRRLDQIALAGGHLAESLDFDTTICRAAQVGVPMVASYCGIDLVGPEGHVRRAAFARDAHPTADLPLDPYAPRGSAAVVRTGEALLLEGPSLADLLALAAGPEALPALRDHVASFVCVPLRAHGRTLGAMSFARAGRLPFVPGDMVLLQEIARHAALAIDNARLYRDAQEADRRKDEFLAMLGHELRNPLAAIVFAVARLKRHSAADGVVLRTTGVVERQGERLVRLVDDLVDVSRITRGKIVLQPRRVQLREIVANAADSMRAYVEARQHTLAVRSPDGELPIDADPTRLEQVFVNLLTNAAKYTDPGGRIEVCLERRNGDAVVHVRDNGIGIEPEMLTTIFAPFSQIDATLDRTDRGLGIGLALAKSIVELHQGRIAAHSEGPGRGTEMVVSLPLPTGEPGWPAPAEGPKPEDVPGPRRRVLVVDDQPDLAALLEEELAAMGHDVRVAHDGLEALGAAKDFSPELMFIDIGLPGLTGYEVAEQMRREPELANAKLVALTGYGGEDTVSRCRNAGFDRHFTKPIDEDALRSLLAG